MITNHRPDIKENLVGLVNLKKTMSEIFPHLRMRANQTNTKHTNEY
jgi:hypothetical protein